MKFSQDLTFCSPNLVLGPSAFEVNEKIATKFSEKLDQAL